jgi:FkbM family methyltransferase
MNDLAWAAVAASVAIGLLGAGLAWRAWRRLAVIRLNVDSLQERLKGAEGDIVILTRQSLVARYRQTHEIPAVSIPLRSCSQHGEDSVLWELLQEKRAGYYIEVGAYDGVTFSNSYFFEAIGWTGLLVEPHPDLHARCRAARPGSRVVQAAVGRREATGTVALFAVDGAGGVDALSYTRTDDAHAQRVQREGGMIVPVQVPLTSLAALLALDPPAAIDFASIDVEGAELDVLDGLSLDRWRPEILLIEDNSGGRDRHVAEYVAQFGYRHVRRRGCNDFYQRH